MAKPVLPEHFFISYARADERYVARLRRRLEAQAIPVWIDSRDILPGTPDWEKSIRAALDAAYGVVLVSSPEAASSEYVKTELALAKGKGLTVIPIWVAGDEWLDSSPLSAAHLQYLDLRKKKFLQGANALGRNLRQILAEKRPRHALVQNKWADSDWIKGPPRHALIFLDEFDFRKPRDQRNGSQKVVAVDPTAYDSLQNLLGELHANYLADRFPPLTYGTKWVLQDRTDHGQFVAPKRIIVPWAWLQAPLTPISQSAPGWGRRAPSAYGIVPGVALVVMEPDVVNNYDSTLRRVVFGLALNNDELLQEVLYGPGKQPHPAVEAGYLKRVSIVLIDPKRYAHTVVVDDPWTSFAGSVLTETKKRFNLKEFEEKSESHLRYNPSTGRGQGQGSKSAAASPRPRR